MQPLKKVSVSALNISGQTRVGSAKVLGLLIASTLTAALLTSCPDNQVLTTIKQQISNADSYNVTYNGNGNTSGTAPTDPGRYKQGATVTVLGNTGGLAKTGYGLAGWNTLANGSGTTYTQGQTFTMGNADVILYAVWAIPHTVTYNANGATGNVPVDNNSYVPGQFVTALGNTGNLVSSGNSFGGWTTNPNTTGPSASYAAGAKWAMGSSNATLYAVWIPSSLNFTSSGTAITIIGFSTAPTGTLAIPSGVTSIGYSAFENCSGITSVTIPSSVVSIGSGSFSFCSGLMSISVDTSNPNYMSSSGVLFNKAATILVQAPAGAMTSSYAIPSSVTSIGDVAFSNCSNLTGSFTIPSNVTSIGNCAFYNCSGITSVTIPSSVVSIGFGPFSFCSGLTSISVDSSNSNYISSSGVLFSKAETALIQAPAAMTSGYSIPSTVTSIGDNAFIGCTGLPSIAIPPSVASIGQSAFFDCSGLTNITIPVSVTSISSQAFEWCSKLTGVYMQSSTPPSLSASSHSFDSEASGFKIHVPSAAAVSAYDAATGWSDYASEIGTP